MDDVINTDYLQAITVRILFEIIPRIATFEVRHHDKWSFIQYVGSEELCNLR